MNCPWMQIAALLLCMVLFVFTVLSAVLVIGHATHECTGHGCLACIRFYRVTRFFRQMFLMATGLHVAAGLSALFPIPTGVLSREPSGSPVSLKVRLNH